MRIFMRENGILDFNTILNSGKTPLTKDMVFYNELNDIFLGSGDCVGGKYYLAYEADKHRVIELREEYGTCIEKKKKRRILRIPKRITTEEELKVYIMRKPIGERLLSEYETEMILNMANKTAKNCANNKYKPDKKYGKEDVDYDKYTGF